MQASNDNTQPTTNPGQAAASGPQIACMEVWGGSQLTTRGVTMGGLDAWVYSKPFGEAQRGGDVYYASNCATGRITRLLLADVSGHGTSVAATAANLRTLMRRFVNRLDQKEFVRLLNEQFTKLSESGTFATAVVSTFFAPTQRLIVCNAGHPRPLIYRASTHQWSFLGCSDGADADTGSRNIPLGILDLTDYEQCDVELHTGDCVLNYTDALIEARDADGEMLGEAGLLRILRFIGDPEPGQLTKILLREIRDRYPENLTEDDVTVLLVRANGVRPRMPLRETVWAQLRFLGSLFRAINPKAERPPFPDLNIANIGGAIIPSLQDRWRAPQSSREAPNPSK